MHAQMGSFVKRLKEKTVIYKLKGRIRSSEGTKPVDTLFWDF